ncbi:DUF4864 domain-containing protein [Rhizobium sp. RU36D]|uniref:DUF4864 domain-containing protein n=1 Tax=Rhizobium sp. RU36D TaxID=1907415 RepID=UPI0009D81E0D|nr:DUF4864 domain-containing protein [Rhizobium sp. RU36D]SMC67970.1 protein of unknown function [Rhizobium sp. RU36D]
MRFPRFVVCVLVTLFMPFAAQAGDAVREAQTIISGQIAAFLKDDASAAYAFASPEIKSRFPDAETFFGMVKKSYGPVYKPGNYAFGRNQSAADGSRVFQEVLISDPKGVSWAAFYDLVRQPDGKFVINGVRMARDTVNQGI